MDCGTRILVAVSAFLVGGSIANLVVALLTQSGVVTSAMGVGATVTGLLTVVAASARR